MPSQPIEFTRQADATRPGRVSQFVACHKADKGPQSLGPNLLLGLGCDLQSPASVTKRFEQGAPELVSVTMAQEPQGLSPGTREPSPDQHSQDRPPLGPSSIRGAFAEAASPRPAPRPRENAWLRRAGNYAAPPANLQRPYANAAPAVKIRAPSASPQ